MSVIIDKGKLRQMLHIFVPELYHRATVGDGCVWIGLYLNGVRAFPASESIPAKAVYREGPRSAEIAVVDQSLGWDVPVDVQSADVGVSLARDAYPVHFSPVRLNAKARKGDHIAVIDLAARVVMQS